MVNQRLIHKIYLMLNWNCMQTVYYARLETCSKTLTHILLNLKMDYSKAS